MCRTCTTDTSSHLQPLFNDPNLSKQLQEYAGVDVRRDDNLITLEINKWFELYYSMQVKPADGLPDQICTTCIENLQLVHTFLSGCKRADEHLRNLVHRTMSSKNSFQSLSMDPGTPDGTQSILRSEARMRKQVISERRYSNLRQKRGISSQSLKCLIPTDREKESLQLMAIETHQISVESELIHSEDCRNEDVQLLSPTRSSQDSISQAKSTDSSGKSDEFLLVVSKCILNNTQDQNIDNEDSEYIITDVVENDYNEDDEDDDQMEHNGLNKFTAKSFKQLNESDSSSVKVEQEQRQDPIDLGAACEATSFPRHSCSKCGNSFPNQTQLKSHLRSHGSEKNYECE